MLKVPAREVVKAMWKKQYVLIFNLLGSDGGGNSESIENEWRKTARFVRILLEICL